MSASICLNTTQQFPIDITLSDYDDEALLGLLGKTESIDCSIMTTLISRHTPWIVKRCIFRLGNYHDAEEAAQEITLRFVRSLHQFQHRSKFKTWLNTIIDNYCHSYASSRNRHVINEQMEIMLKSEQLENIPDPSIVLANIEIVSLVLSSLPERSRQILNLRFYHEYSLQELSDSLFLSLSATKARLYRSIELFKKAYNRQDRVEAQKC